MTAWQNIEDSEQYSSFNIVYASTISYN